MATDTSVPVPAPIVAPLEQSEFALPLSDFCTQLSATDKRVESIGAFYSTEKAAGRYKDLPSAYAVRFAAFLTKPM